MVSRSRAKFERSPVTQRRKLRFESKRLGAMPTHNAIQLKAHAAERRRMLCKSRHGIACFQAKALSAEAHRRHRQEPKRLAAALRRTAFKSEARMRHTLAPCGKVRLSAARRRRNWRSATLHDTELRKIFRRKNTPRKSFLGHAHRLNDLPVEAATARPTQRPAAHSRKHAGPRFCGGPRQHRRGGS
jgi:hypothetical protein